MTSKCWLSIGKFRMETVCIYLNKFELNRRFHQGNTTRHRASILSSENTKKFQAVKKYETITI